MREKNDRMNTFDNKFDNKLLKQRFCEVTYRDPEITIASNPGIRDFYNPGIPRSRSRDHQNPSQAFTEVKGGTQMHVRARAYLIRISGTAGRIALKLFVWLGDH